MHYTVDLHRKCYRVFFQIQTQLMSDDPHGKCRGTQLLIKSIFSGFHCSSQWCWYYLAWFCEAKSAHDTIWTFFTPSSPNSFGFKWFHHSDDGVSITSCQSRLTKTVHFSANAAPTHFHFSNVNSRGGKIKSGYFPQDWLTAADHTCKKKVTCLAVFWIHISWIL